jgi:acyl-ACP thioesterase
VLYNNEKGNVIARGTSGWLAIDRTSKRPQRLDEFRKIVPLLEEDALRENLEKLPPPEDEYQSFQREASYDDIDMNHHVNNVAYIRWIQDSLQEEFHKTWIALKLSINFLSETFFGDPVEIRIGKEKKEEGKETLSLSGGILTGGRPACTARIIYGKR